MAVAAVVNRLAWLTRGEREGGRDDAAKNLFLEFEFGMSSSSSSSICLTNVEDEASKIVYAFVSWLARRIPRTISEKMMGQK